MFQYSNYLHIIHIFNKRFPNIFSFYPPTLWVKPISNFVIHCNSYNTEIFIEQKQKYLQICAVFLLFGKKRKY